MSKGIFDQQGDFVTGEKKGEVLAIKKVEPTATGRTPAPPPFQETPVHSLKSNHRGGPELAAKLSRLAPVLSAVLGHGSPQVGDEVQIKEDAKSQYLTRFLGRKGRISEHSTGTYLVDFEGVTEPICVFASEMRVTRKSDCPHPHTMGRGPVMVPVAWKPLDMSGDTKYRDTAAYERGYIRLKDVLNCLEFYTDHKSVAKLDASPEPLKVGQDVVLHPAGNSALRNHEGRYGKVTKILSPLGRFPLYTVKSTETDAELHFYGSELEAVEPPKFEMGSDVTVMVTDPGSFLHHYRGKSGQTKTVCKVSGVTHYGIDAGGGCFLTVPEQDLVRMVDPLSKADIFKPTKTIRMHILSDSHLSPLWWDRPAMAKGDKVVVTTATPEARQEAPCPRPSCGKPNDIGVKTCWCCGGNL